MSDGRRLRLREQGTTKGPVRTQRKVRNRLGSVSCSNEESTEGEDDTVGCAKKISGGVNRNRVAERPKDTDRGLRTGIKKNNRSNGIRVPLAEEDVIDGFLILSFMTYQDLEVSKLRNCSTINFFEFWIVQPLADHDWSEPVIIRENHFVGRVLILSERFTT